MNDQTSPTADGQGQDSPQWRDPFEEPRGAQGLPGPGQLTPGQSVSGQSGPAQLGPGQPGPGQLGPAQLGPGQPGPALLATLRPDLLAAAILLVTGAALGVLAALAWYRFAPTVWLTLPANAVPQVTSNVDQSALLVSPEAKGIASVDGYYFLFTGIVGVILGIFGFWLGRRGFLAGRDHEGSRQGAAIGAWAGVLLGGLAASTLAAALGHWVSMPDPLSVLHTIAAGHNFHAPVALHAQGLYLAAPLLGTLLFLALTWSFTKPSAPAWQGPQGYFTAQNPYGLPAGQQVPQPQPGQHSQPGQPGQPGQSGQSNGAGPDATPGAASGAQQAGNTRG